MAKFDLTGLIGQYLDRHLVLPHLEFLSARAIFNEHQLLQAKLDTLSKTNMIDYLIDVKQQLHPDINVPEEMRNRRQEILSELARLQENAKVVLDLINDDKVMKKMESMRDSKALIKFLAEEADFRIEMMDDIVKLAKYRYECGNYQVSSSYLYFYMLVMSPTDKNYLNASWGKLASEILTQEWDTALEDINKMREYIDSNVAIGNSLHVLQQRTWLIHWSLFVFFNHIKGRDMIIDMFLYRPHYLNAIQTMCPHVLRYLAAAVIVNRSRRSSALKDLVKVIQQESYTYKDPITEFLEHLYVNFDFDGARQKLQECQTVLCNDFFLIALLNEFVENARLMIFETFCRIHQCISIQMLAEKLNMEVDVAECWIVNLIRNARLPAKIDSKLGHVVMGGQPASPYQQLVEKIETLSVRSEALENLIERKVKAKNQDPISIVWN
uniref:Eukaryotic translation initiation factor 3 subunit E n=1 Tax=Encarsia formosa TaxID=32400 RepID=A0A481SYV4_ENCFO|nr:eukaryotic translation initiation factor 3 subunit E [Encarsia formosa]